MSSIFTIIGTGVGAYFGGPTGAVAGASIGSGIDGYISGEEQADQYATTSAYNAAQATSQARYNADSVMNAARINMGLATLGASVDAQGVQAVAHLNAYFQRESAAYNASLLRDDAQSVLEALDLDIETVNKQYRRILGATEVGYTSSGVRIDIDTDTPNLVLLDIATERELETMILTHNGQEQARQLLNAAARSEFEGNMAAAQIMFEGQQRAGSIQAGASLSRAGMFINAYNTSNSIKYEGGVSSSQQLYNGRTNATSSRQAGDRALVSGLIQGGAALYSAREATPAGGTTSSGGGYDNGSSGATNG